MRVNTLQYDQGITCCDAAREALQGALSEDGNGFRVWILAACSERLTGSAPDEVGRADERRSDGLALVRVRERLVDPLERVVV